jgi:homoserine kinase
MKLIIRVPSSTANLGPGFDVLGMALGLYLTVYEESSTKMSIENKKTRPGPWIPKEHLLVQVAEKTATTHQAILPPLSIVCDSDIPAGSGLGSSAAIVVAGVLMANAACQLSLSPIQILDMAVSVEGHADNVAAALSGGLRICYQNIPCPISKKVKAIVVTPDFELRTSTSRRALPESYSQSDVVFNLQRISLLLTALAQEEPDARLVGLGMQDRVHQPYRLLLVPGLETALQLKMDGLLGICLSGAGPTILALATHSFDTIGSAIAAEFKKHLDTNGKPIQSIVRILHIDHVGATVQTLE